MLIKAGSVPKTSSGKIQRHACRQGFLDDTLDVVGRWQIGEPLGEAEEPAELLDGQIPEKTAKEFAALYAAGPPPAPHGAPASSNGNRAPGDKRKAAELVIEEIRRVARERAVGLTLDSPIIETGLDSLERMEILASLEERFGGRFPQEILPQLETTRQVIEAVEKYLGAEPRPLDRCRRPAEIPPEAYRFDQFPEYVELRKGLDLLDDCGLGNPFFGVHQGITNDRTIIGGRELINFASYNYVGMSGDPVVSKATKEAIDRYGTSVSASRLVSGEKDLHGELERAMAAFLGTEDAMVFVGGHATNETVIGHLLGPADLVLHDALAHNSIVQGAILSGARRRPFTHNDSQAADPAAGAVPAGVSPRADGHRGRVQHGRRHPRSAPVHRGQDSVTRRC